MSVRTGRRRQNIPSKGRHPLLKHGSTLLMVFNYIKMNPDCISTEIRDACDVPFQPIADLLDEGLIEITGKRDKFNTYRVCNATGSGRDKVRVRVTISEDQDGWFYATAEVIRDVKMHMEEWVKRTPVVAKEITITVPPKGTDLQISASKNEGLIIEGESFIVDEV